MLIVFAAVLVAVIGGYALMSLDGEGDAGMDVSGTDVTPPSSNDADMGHAAIVAEYGTQITVRAVPDTGMSFYGWFEDGTLISDRMIETFPKESVDSIEAVFSEGFTKSVEYDWEMPLFSSEGEPSGLTRHMTFSVYIWSGDYWTSVMDDGRLRHATYADPMPTFMLDDSSAVDQAVEYLDPLMDGLTNLQKATVLAYFVQDTISYMSDAEQYGVTEFWASAEETLYTGYGDCEDTATLLVNLGARLGLDVGFVAFESSTMGHMSAAVALEDGESAQGDAVFDVDGARYAYVETAIDNAHSGVGQLTPAYSISDGNWTHVVYDGSEYTGSATVPIGSGTVTGAPMIYGKAIPRT